MGRHGRRSEKKQVTTRIGRIILVPDNVADTSLFCLRARTNGADTFKLALCRISRGLERIDAHILQTLHDEIIVEARDAIADRAQAIVKESLDEAFKAGKFLRAVFAAYCEPGSAM